MTEVSDAGTVVGQPSTRGVGPAPDQVPTSALGELVAALVDAVATGGEILLVAHVGCLKLLGVVIDRARLEPEHDLVWTWCGAQDLRRAGVALDEIQGFIDTLRMVSEVEVALICKQEGGAWKVSRRSLGGIDVGALCTEVGGGGHRLAAGFASTAELGAVMDAVRSALARAPRLPGPAPLGLAGLDAAAGAEPGRTPTVGRLLGVR
ncbi:bifunctional oligoribonuclease/PAP phosphatase NrnA [Frankia sp. AgB32]|uniref:DHH family phosphoesterase n=1 Tax=Frankia sp. AgB32 TaxID=631119 RepID=UPI002010A99A|nr:DHHA1 domain-containing protein [Frankia sp. AgB32]MCK9896731.1 DHHA1 domain-containing protein [Frankia sp. AgB32]